MNYTEISALVEASIYELKVDPALCRGDKEGRWNLRIKDSTIWIDVFNFPTNPDKYYFQVMSPLFKATALNQLGIQNDLLEYAHAMYGCGVCKKAEWYFVIALREADGLGQKEVDFAIDKVGYYSSDMYGKFKFKYPDAFDTIPPQMNMN